MWSASILASVVGIAIVVQAGLNREISNASGLSIALFVNCLLTFIFSMTLWALAVWKPDFFPEFVRAQTRGFSITPVHLMAAMGGFCIIFGTPMAIHRMGALKTLALVMSVQLVTALAWDYFREGIPVSLQRVVGAVVTLVGACIALAG